MSDDPASEDGFRWQLRQSLVERLRIRWDGMGEMANQQRAESAITISTMMDEIEAMERSVRHLHRDYADMRTRLTEANLIAAGMHDEIERLTRERDEARREVCCYEAEARSWDAREAGMADWRCFSSQVANERGWDCFSVTNERLPDGKDEESTP